MGLNVALHLLQSNYVILTGQITSGGEQFNLTGYTLSFVLKASATASDGSGVTIVPTVTDEALGEFTLTIPGTDLATAPSTMWYRLDVIDDSFNHVAALYGPVTILAV